MQLLGKAKVHQLHVAGHVQQQVLRLQVPIDDVTRVQIVEGFHHTGRVEPGRSIVKVAAIAQNCPQFTAKAALHQHVEILTILEGLEKLHDEVGIGLQKLDREISKRIKTSSRFQSYLAHDLLFGHDVLLLTGFNDLGLLHLLQCERSCFFLSQLNQLDATETSHAKRGNHS